MLEVISFGSLSFASNYEAGFAPGAEWGLPTAQAQVVERSSAWPVVAGVKRPGARLTLLVRIIGSDTRSLRDALLREFSPEDETPKALVISDTSGSNQRYLLAVCEALQPVTVGKVAASIAFSAQLAVSGDVRWRAVTSTQDTWSITSSGQTRNITNSGTDDAYPVLQIMPTSAKSGGYAYRCWTAVVWRSANAATRYPVRIDLNTQALIGAGKMQADGDDLRLLVDGTERDRWLADINTTATKIWANLDFQPAVAMTLKTAIPSSGSITSIEVNESVERMPESGILLVDSEAFTYTAKVNSERKFTGITRAARGTSQAAHSAGTTVYWIQHDVWLTYGNAAVTAPTTDDRYKPAFSLSSSTNTQWVYEVFGDTDGARSGGWWRWGAVTVTGSGGVYTATQRALASSEYTVIGAWLDSSQGNAYGWYLNNPCGITNIAWSDGKKRRAGDSFLVHCMNWPRGASWWAWHYNPTSPATANVWESWSYSGSAFAVSDTIGIAAYFYPQDVEAGGATVTLNSSETPVVAVFGELGNYPLDCVIENTTTSERIRVTATLALNQTLTVDCDTATVTLEDGTRMLSALQVLGTPRQRWLRFTPGANTLRFTDSGTAGVTFVTTFCARYY